MGRLNTRLPDFKDQYDGRQQRALVQQLETQLARIKVDTTSPAFTVTGDHAVGINDDVVLIDTTAASRTVTLPQISDSMVREKFEVEIVKPEAANRIDVVPTGSDTILGEPDAKVYARWTALRLRATTGNWIVI